MGPLTVDQILPYVHGLVGFGALIALVGIIVWARAKKVKTQKQYQDRIIIGITLVSSGMIPAIFYAAMWIALTG